MLIGFLLEREIFNPPAHPGKGEGVVRRWAPAPVGLLSLEALGACGAALGASTGVQLWLQLLETPCEDVGKNRVEEWPENPLFMKAVDSFS